MDTWKLFLATVLLVLAYYVENLSADHTQGSFKSCGHILNSPMVGLKRNKSLKFSNETNIELSISFQEVVLVCNATYPIEWVFSAYLGNEWNVTDLRYMEMVSKNSSSQIPRYSAELSYRPSSSLRPLEITCRSVEDKYCLQTTVIARRNSAQRNQSISLKIVQNYPQGLLVPQYAKPQGSNVNCSVYLWYNEKEKAFMCYSDRDQLIWSSDENFRPSTCYDQFSCGYFFTESKCELNRKMLRGEALTLPLEGSDPTGLVICKPEDAPDAVSAAIHYYFSLPDFCHPNSRRSPKLYLHNDKRNPDANEFIAICPVVNEPIYRGSFILFSCISSVYLFADGVQMKLKTKGKPDRILTLSNSSTNVQNGYRNYSIEVAMNDTNITDFECYVPFRKSAKWHSQEIKLSVIESSKLQFLGGDDLLTIQYQSRTTIKCLAAGNPQPNFTWTNEMGNKLRPEIQIKEYTEHGYKVSELVIPERNSSAFYGIYNCKADNGVEYKVKNFILQPPDEDEVSLWYIWGIVLPLALIFVGVLVGFLVWKIIKQTKKLRLLTTAELDEFMNGKPEVLNSQRSSTDYDVNSYATCLPYNKNYEVLKEQLEIDANAVLGSGAYGMVLRGLLTKRNGEKVKAAIKTVKPMDDISYFKALMSELKIMGFIGKHDHIVNLLGAFTKNIQNREIFIAIEYCENGNLLHYLRNSRAGFVNYVFNGTLIEINRTSSVSSSMSTLTLLSWAIQIANGMDFLYHKKVIHGDLAARNILLSQMLTAKIGDFGLSRQLFEYANYIKKHQSPLPWKWLALECLQDMKFSSKSDVWAYGITLWEIFSLGQVPFAGMRYNDEFMDTLIEGKRPSRPQYATTDIYDVMFACWNTNPSERPSFLYIKEFFDKIIRNMFPEEYVDLIDSLQLTPHATHNVKP